MPLVFSPDFPKLWPISPSPPACSTDFLTIFLGQSITWSDYKTFSTTPTQYWHRYSPAKDWQSKSGTGGTFTPPTAGCYYFWFPLKDYYNGVYISGYRMVMLKVIAASVPVAAFEGFPTSGDRPLTVLFTDESTNTPTSWLWNFGDGLLSAERNPTHIYNVAGVYSVVLSATNPAGTGTLTKTDYITVAEPPPPPPYVEPIWTLKIGPI